MHKTKKEFDFSKYKQRRIALKILYFGWDYAGLADQTDAINTIEHHLFQALTKACLIKSRDTCNYNRCGRTDKGVSSFGQVVDLNIRSNLLDEEEPQNVGLFSPPDYVPDDRTAKRDDNRTELNYVEILNRLLPDEIKAIAWAPVKEGFSSRFSCRGRSYSYIFPKGDLCIESMQKAANYLVGTYDYRNLCSWDLNAVTDHTRTIMGTEIRPLNFSKDLPAKQYPNSFYEVIIQGQGFLYHQIRCIMSILFLVGTKSESPEVVRDLLDVERCPARPNYNKASPLPLCLFDCKYSADDLPLGWIHDQRALANLLKHLKQLWCEYKTKTLMIERALFDIQDLILSGDHEQKSDECEKSDCKRLKLDLNRWRDFGITCDTMSDNKYVPLMKRPRGEPLEKRLETLRDKKKTNKDQ